MEQGAVAGIVIGLGGSAVGQHDFVVFQLYMVVLDHPSRLVPQNRAVVDEVLDWYQDTVEIERVAADSEAVGGALDFGRIGPLPHALHVAVERTSAKIVSAWRARAGP